MMEDHKRDFDTLIEQINQGLTKHLENEVKGDIQEFHDSNLLKSEKLVEEDDRSTRIQEHSNDDVEFLQPLEESLEEPVMNKEEFPIAIHVHDQPLVEFKLKLW